MYPFRKTATAGMCFPTTRLLIAALLASVALASAQVRTIDATIDTSKTGVPISKYIYGQFLEHGGDIVNTGIWSEMLVDRKFYYPVATAHPRRRQFWAMLRGTRECGVCPLVGGRL